MKAIIYARVSSLGDRQNTERQISDLKQYAAYQKLEISCRLLTTASKIISLSS